ncbi:scavenger receptor cysteine-rich type 1 protein M130-like [Mastacembelus armatus]|uniref:scavenger receptor cysteine-rich type 1 protein M130-like n=1 Tax=Mastacembelus armatus TaxID=205130 RepID=UPI000E45DAAA|nr:scavenger receptor cysteine-rich type 1 protein M130-like [Mastacembelus armatus]
MTRIKSEHFEERESKILFKEDFARLVNGTSPCSGRLEVKSHQWWSSVCEADFDQRDAEVVCRELDCGAPLVLQGVLYGEVETPMWTREFQCGGHESALLDCRSSDSDRNTCSPGKAVGLTCSEPVRLVGGNSRCAGTLEVKHKGDWRTVDGYDWTLKTAAVACRELDCGSAVSVAQKEESSNRFVWLISPHCVESKLHLRDCVNSYYSSYLLDLTCSDFARLVNGTSLCSGRLEVKSNQWWSSVCEADFDQRDAEVVCRELGCGAPLLLQGALYGEVEAPMWTREFQCGGHESALLDCRSSDSDRNTCSPGKAVGLTCSEPVRLVGGNSRCAGTLEVKHKGDWRTVDGYDWTLKTAAVVYSVRLVNGTSPCSGRLEVKSHQWWSSVCEADFDQRDAEVVCRELGCGAPLVLQGVLYGEVEAPMWTREFQCGGHESALLDCRSSDSDRNTCSPGKAVGLTCSEPVRLVGGNSRCAGTLEVKHKGDWRTMDGHYWTLKTANVVCRERDCGSAVSVEWSMKGTTRDPGLFQRTAPQVNRDPGPFLEDGPSGEQESAAVPKGGPALEPESRAAPEDNPSADQELQAIQVRMGRLLGPHPDRGPPVSDLGTRPSGFGSAPRSAYVVYAGYEGCGLSSVRLVNGTSLCSGRLEVKSNQSNQWWSSVCEADFDQRDAEVVCRELGCGAPLVLQGALYGEVEAPMWTREFQCGGNESALLDCRSSDSDRNTCSPGKAVGLTCSEPVRLVGGNSRCAGTLEVKHKGDWRPVFGDYWTLKTAAVACRQLDCGSAVSVQLREESSFTSVWQISPYCVQSSLRDCVRSGKSSSFITLNCSASVRLVNGTSLCSGRLEVKSNQSNQWWSSVCEADFDQQDAEVVCRELGCGAPLVLQGALYGEVEAPMWTREFQCGGHESALLDCRSSDSDRNTCSPGKAVGLTCSEPVRLVGGNSRCAGTLEVKHKGDWRPVGDDEWTLKTANVACRQLDCGSAVSIEKEEFSVGQVWTSNSKCVQSGSALRDCVQTISNKHILNLNCSVTVMDSIGLNCKA